MKPRTPRALVVACVLALVSIVLISCAILHPAPLMVIAAMSLGQGVGTIGAGLFVVVVARDLRAALKPAESAPERSA